MTLCFWSSFLKDSRHRNRKLLNKEQILFIALAPVLTNLTMTFLTDGIENLLFPWEEQNAVSEMLLIFDLTTQDSKSIPSM